MLKKEIHLQENTLFDLELWAMVRGNGVQYPLHHVIYAPVKFKLLHLDLHLHLHRYVEPSQFDYYTTVLTSNGDTLR